MLGVIGLGVILVRHVVERRGVLALLRAVGVRRRTVAAMLVGEQIELAAAGIVNGVLAALSAMGPSIGGRLNAGMLLGLGGWALAVLAAGFTATALAAWVVTRGRPFDALRDE
jgi:ABC-type antimicrobial peptide transport system permease subunit